MFQIWLDIVSITKWIYFELVIIWSINSNPEDKNFPQRAISKIMK